MSISNLLSTTVNATVMPTICDVVIIKADVNHSGPVRQLFNEHFTFNDVLTSSLLTESKVRSNLGSKNFEVFLAKNTTSDQFVGSCVIERIFSLFVGQIIWMDQLFVKPSFRGQKIGLRLIKAAATVAKEENAVLRWDCGADNLPGIKFHQSFGGQIISETFFKKINQKLVGFELDQEAIDKLLSDVAAD